MMPVITDRTGEDDQFMQILRHTIAGELEAKPVHGLFVIRIDNWFDHRWRNFSGKGRVGYGLYTGLAAYDPDTSLDEFHRDGRQSTFPPFAPNRVLTQDFYGKGDAGDYVLDENGAWVHPSWRERSSSNLHRRITTCNNSCLFVWFSSNTVANRRGSIMIYRAYGRIISSWYASFAYDGRWKLSRCDGIARQHLLSWFATANA